MRCPKCGSEDLIIYHLTDEIYLECQTCGYTSSMKNKDRLPNVKIYARLEYVSMDAEGNIVIGLSKRSSRETTIKLLRPYEGKEVYVFVAEGKWAVNNKHSKSQEE